MAIIMVVAAVSSASRILTRARRAAPWSDRHLSSPWRAAASRLVQSSGPPRGVFCVRDGRRRKQGRLCPRFGTAGQERTSHNGRREEFGKTGTVAYVVTELAFWAVAFHGLLWIQIADGAWLDLSDPGDKAKLGRAPCSLMGFGSSCPSGWRLPSPSLGIGRGTTTTTTAGEISIYKN